eukprot:scaffold237_cov117-Isochrysis_galbana.AAC.7
MEVNESAHQAGRLHLRIEAVDVVTPPELAWQISPVAIIAETDLDAGCACPAHRQHEVGIVLKVDKPLLGADELATVTEARRAPEWQHLARRIGENLPIGMQIPCSVPEKVFEVGQVLAGAR